MSTWQRDRPTELSALTEATRRHLMGTGPPALLPQQALCYPLPSHLPRAIAELHAHQVRRTTIQQHQLRSSLSAADGPSISPPANGLLRFCYASVTFDSSIDGKGLGAGGFMGGGGHMKSIFALHNRSRVEVVAFSLSSSSSTNNASGQIDSSRWRDSAAMAVGADYFVSLAGYAEPAMEMRRWLCSVAFHLDGYSSHAR